MREIDKIVGFELTENFERFNQMNDIFTRAFWDDEIKSSDTEAFFNSYRSGFVAKRAEGFNQKDFALRNASWLISDLISNRSAASGIREGFQAYIQNDTPVAENKIPIEDERQQSKEVKRVAKLFGADLVGITSVDERWHYSHRVDTTNFEPVQNELPKDCNKVIVMAHAMDYDLVETYPSALAGASSGREYSHEAAICMQLAAYIRGLGYEAIASMNDTALVIPYAIKAGLGEYGRNQMVITPEYGPRVRFSKIFTSLPLEMDYPKSLGIKEYCNSCTKCASACPPKALPFGEPGEKTDSVSTMKGVKKWSANCEKCFGYWAKIRTDCAICMRVCPFNRKYNSFTDKLWRWLATSSFRKVAIFWEELGNSRKRLKPSQWWS
ncbi:MAG: reductive dehalogenase domain-containing protein [Paracoccaceae bacterium]|nr:reductive dehalogenase domain-containing protein [Paracoccaceae bacterium]